MRYEDDTIEEIERNEERDGQTRFAFAVTTLDVCPFLRRSRSNLGEGRSFPSMQEALGAVQEQDSSTITLP